MKSANKAEANEIIKSIQAGLEDVKSGRVQPIEKLCNELDN